MAAPAEGTNINKKQEAAGGSRAPTPASSRPSGKSTVKQQEAAVAPRATAASTARSGKSPEKQVVADDNVGPGSVVVLALAGAALGLLGKACTPHGRHRAAL